MGTCDRLTNIIRRLEGRETPFLYYILIFLSSITLRNFLEIFSDQASVPFKLFPAASTFTFGLLASFNIAISFAHYYVFWIFTFLGLGIIFSLITKTNIVSVLKTLFSLSPIIIITPIFDLLITGGRGIEIAYAHPGNIFELFPLPKIVTPGMLVTSLTAAALAFIYAKIKTGRWIKGLIAAVTLYLLLVFLSALPVIVGANHPIPIIWVLLIGISLEIACILFIAERARFTAVWRGMRWLRVSHYISMLLLGILITGHPLFKSIADNLSCFLLTVIALVLGWAGAIMFNDAEDYEIDNISNKDRLLTKNVFSREELIGLSLWLFAAAAVIAAAVNFTTLFFTLLVIGNSCLYSLPPLRLKRAFLFSKLFISASSLALVILGWLFAGRDILRFPRPIIWYFIIFVTMAMNIIDIKDVEGDRKAGIKTLPVVFGLKRAKIFTGIFILIAYCMLGLALLDKRILLAAALLGITQFILINRKVFKEKWAILTHLAGIVSLLAYLNSPFWVK